MMNNEKKSGKYVAMIGGFVLLTAVWASPAAAFPNINWQALPCESVLATILKVSDVVKALADLANQLEALGYPDAAKAVAKEAAEASAEMSDGWAFLISGTCLLGQ